MTPNEIKQLIASKIVGQGSMVDVGGALPAILNAIVDAITTIPAAQIQSDWDQSEPISLDFIKHKPICFPVDNTASYSVVPYCFDFVSTDMATNPSSITKEVLESHGMTLDKVRDVFTRGMVAFVTFNTAGQSAVSNRFLPLTIGIADQLNDKYQLTAVDIAYDTTAQKLKGTQYTFTLAENPEDTTPPVQVTTFEI